jgi:hypothetical protein
MAQSCFVGHVTRFGAWRFSVVILSAAKDLMPIASGDEVLRCAQDDVKPETSGEEGEWSICAERWTVCWW